MDFENLEEEREKSCEKCGLCCKYIAIEIDCPEDLEDFENIKWYVAHENVNVFVNEDNEWHVEFLTLCSHLGKDNLCEIYTNRPKICRTYSPDSCLTQNNYSEKYTFKNIEDVEKYIREIFYRGLHELPEIEDEDSEEKDEGELDEDYEDEESSELRTQNSELGDDEVKSESPSEFIPRKDRDYYY